NNVILGKHFNGRKLVLLLSRLLQLPRSLKRTISLCTDALAILAALVASYCLSFNLELPPRGWEWLAVYVALTIGSIALFTKLGLYRAVVRYVSLRALAVVVFGVAVSTLWL